VGVVRGQHIAGLRVRDDPGPAAHLLGQNRHTGGEADLGARLAELSSADGGHGGRGLGLFPVCLVTGVRPRGRDGESGQ
jgi:hypothetical protein